MSVKKIEILKDSLAIGYFDHYHYADSYQGSFEKHHKITPVDVVKSFFTATPPWVIVLMKLRDAVVRVLGIKVLSVKQIEEDVKNFSGQIGESFGGSFSVLALRENEILLGEMDKHLDFCISFLLLETNSTYELSLNSVVKFNGWLGRLYFLPVKPMHKLISKVLLKRMIKELES